MTGRLTISDAAARSGVKVPTIRYYEQIGLVPEPMRTEGNRRLYGEGELRRLDFIHNARELGFSIEDIRELLAMSAEPQASCHEVDSIARGHLAEIEIRIERLQALRSELERMISECGHGRVCDCRIIEAIAGAA